VTEEKTVNVAFVSYTVTDTQSRHDVIATWRIAYIILCDIKSAIHFTGMIFCLITTVVIPLQKADILYDNNFTLFFAIAT